MRYILINLMSFLLISSCMGEIKPKGEEADLSEFVGNNFAGCISAQGTSTNTINVEFLFPDDAEEIQIYRNGLLVNTTTAREEVIFEDTSLEEGKSYTYRCYAKVDGKISVGSKKVVGRTIAVNAPVFSGIRSVDLTGPTSGVVLWPPATGGASVSYYQIFATRGTEVNFLNPSFIIPSGSFSYSFLNLADQMDYSFAVRACNANDICDNNTVEIKRTTADKGLPTSIGVTNGFVENGVGLLTVPWSERDGGVYKRNIYRSLTNSVTSILSNKILSPLVSDYFNPSTEVIDSTIIEGSTYYYIVRDEDSSGNENLNTNVVTVSVGDLTPPDSFLGLLSAVVDNTNSTSEETQVVLTFNTITHSPQEASSYLLYMTSAQPPSIPSNPCNESTPFLVLPPTGFLPNTDGVTYTVPGLASRKKYSFCMKAQDASANISSTIIFRSVTMKDNTSPEFDGIQGFSYDGSLQKFNVVWNPRTNVLANESTSYHLMLWKNTLTPTDGDITTLTFLHSVNPTGRSFDNSDFSFGDGDTIYATVNVCDDAYDIGLGYALSNNCTLYTPISKFMSIHLNDTTPPGNWFGVTAASAFGGQGFLKVDWILPSDVSDYNRFNFYLIEKSGPGSNDYTKTFLDVKTCPSGNCTSITSHILNLATTPLGSRDHFDYTIYASAVDAAGNETDVSLSPYELLLKSQTVTSSDESIPVFNSNLSLVVDGGSDAVSLSWGLASDNQYIKKNYFNLNQLTYSLYRKTGALNFEFPGEYDSNNVPIESNPKIEKIASGLTVNNFNDTLSTLTPGQQYWYIVCATDSSSNTNCDKATIKDVNIGDNVAPTVAVTFSNSANSVNWNINMTVNDFPKDPTSARVDVWKKFTDSKFDYPTTADTYIGNQFGQGTASASVEFTFASDSLSNDSTGTNHYVTYLVRTLDGVGNSADYKFSHLIRAPRWRDDWSWAKGRFECLEDTQCDGSVNSQNGGHMDLFPGVNLDPDISGLKVYVYSAPANGVIGNCYGLDGTDVGVGQDHSCSYSQSLTNFNGVDQYVLCAMDDVIISSPGMYPDACKTMLVIISPVDDPAIAVDDYYSATLDSLFKGVGVNINILENDIDVDGLMIEEVVAIPTAPSHGTLDCSVGTSCVYIANDYFVGVDTMSYQLTNGSVGTIKVKVYTSGTWTGAIDNNWHDKRNWCGTPVTGRIMTVSDIPCPGETFIPNHDIFLGGGLCLNCDPLISSDLVNVGMMRIVDGYIGTITGESGVNFSGDGIFIMNDGFFDFSNAASFRHGSFYLGNKATFRAPPIFELKNFSSDPGNTDPGVFEFWGAFEHNNGKAIISAFEDGIENAKALTIVGNVNFYDLVVNAGNDDYIYLSNGSIEVGNDLAVNSGKLQIASSINFSVKGDVNLKYSSPTSYAQFHESDNLIIANGNLQMIHADDGAGIFSLKILNGSNISVTSINLNISSLDIVDGHFSAPIGELKINGDYRIFSWRDVSDDSNIIGLRLGVDGEFTHNNGKVIFKSLATNDHVDEGSWNMFSNGILTGSPLVFNDLSINMAGYTPASSLIVDSEYEDGAFVLSDNADVIVMGVLNLEDGNIMNGELKSFGEINILCSDKASYPCFRGGSTKVSLLGTGITEISMNNNATAPVLSIESGESVDIVNIGGGSLNARFTALQILNGTINAPDVMNFQLSRGGEGINGFNNIWGNADATLYASTSGVFSHNNGQVNLLYETDLSVDSDMVKIESPSGMSFFNLNISNSDSNGTHESRSSLVSGTEIFVENNLTITNSELRAGKAFVGGNISISGLGGLVQNIELTGAQNQFVSQDGSSKNLGTLVINKSGGEVVFSSDFSGVNNDWFLVDIISPSLVYDNNYVIDNVSGTIISGGP